MFQGYVGKFLDCFHLFAGASLHSDSTPILMLQPQEKNQKVGVS